MHLSRRGQNIFIYHASIRTVTLNNNHHYPRLLLSQLTVTLAGRRTDVRVQQERINQESKKLNMSAKINKVKQNVHMLAEFKTHHVNKTNKGTKLN